MSIHTLSTKYKQLQKDKKAEIAAIETKYYEKFYSYHQDLAFMTFLGGNNRITFEGWEIERKRLLLNSLDSHGVKYQVKQYGGGYEVYDVVLIDWAI